MTSAGMCCEMLKPKGFRYWPRVAPIGQLIPEAISYRLFLFRKEINTNYWVVGHLGRKPDSEGAFPLVEPDHTI